MALKQFVPDFTTFVNENYEVGEHFEMEEAQKTSGCCGAAVMEDGTCAECGMPAVTEDNDMGSSKETDLPQVPGTEPEVEPFDEFEKDPNDIEHMDPEVAVNAIAEGRKKKPYIGPTFKELNKGKGKKQPPKPEPPKYQGIKGKKVFKKDFGKMAEPAGPRVKDKDKDPNQK